MQQRCAHPRNGLRRTNLRRSPTTVVPSPPVFAGQRRKRHGRRTERMPTGHVNDRIIVRRNYTSADGFPNDTKKAVATANAKPKDGKATCSFAGVAPGGYAVALFHDENDNAKMDTNFIGIPKEGYGFSNNARGRLSAPTFEQAAFSLKAVAEVLDLTIAY